VAKTFCIECECPTFNVDFDVDGPGIPGPDDLIKCAECGDQHRLGDIGQFYLLDGEGIITMHLNEDQWRDAAKGTINGYHDVVPFKKKET
jgi:hypothetical protein